MEETSAPGMQGIIRRAYALHDALDELSDAIYAEVKKDCIATGEDVPAV